MDQSPPEQQPAAPLAILERTAARSTRPCPMTNLDPRSLIAMAGLMASLMAVVLYFMRRYYPPSIQGIGYWPVPR